MNKKKLRRVTLRVDKKTLRALTDSVAVQGGMIGISATLCVGDTCYLDCVASVPFTRCGPQCT